MHSFTFCIILSSFCFLGYGIAYFVGPNMKKEFKRFGLEKYALLTIFLELLGAVGLLVGYFFNIKLILVLSAVGLALLMFLGILIRIKVKDGLFVILPAIFFLLLNIYISWFSIYEF
jgi:hypothetical protein